MITDLVYDVGINNGDDTAHDLQRGYRVVAIEADPTLIDPANGGGWAFPFGSSGPFGEETAGTWQTLDEVAFTWTADQLGHSHDGHPGLNVWHDVHARLGSDAPGVQS